MAVQTKSQIKSYFVRGAKPTQAQYVDLIDSYQNYSNILTDIDTKTSAGQTGIIDIRHSTSATFVQYGSIGMQVLLSQTATSAKQVLNIGAAVSADFATTAQAIAGLASGISMDPVLTRNFWENNISRVSAGGTGRDAFIPYGPIIGGISSAAAMQAVSPGTSGQIFTSNGVSAAPTFQSLSIPTNWTYSSISAASGSSLDITGLPSTVTEITIFPASVQSNGSGTPYVQIRDSGGLETSGYLGASWENGGSVVNNSSGFLLTNGFANNTPISGVITLYRSDSSSNTWNMQGTMGYDAQAQFYSSTGKKSLSATLDGFSIITPNTWVAGTFYYRYR